MVCTRLIAFFLVSAVLINSTSPLVAREIENPYDLTQKINADEAIILDLHTPRKLSWTEWFSTLGSKFKTDPEQYKLLCSVLLLGGALVFAAHPITHIDNAQQYSSTEILPTLTSLFSMLTSQFLRCCVVKIAHEAGHALTSYAITNQCSDIYLGAAEASDGVEILPHVILSGLNPAMGVTTSSLYTQEELRGKVTTLYLKFKKIYPELTVQEITALPQYQDALKMSLKDKSQIFALYIAGVISGLLANGLIKLSTGESVCSLDVLDVLQLTNLIPNKHSDGGIIANEVFEIPNITELGNKVRDPAVLTSLFLKALTTVHIQNPNNNALQTILHAAGMAVVNFAGQGIFHI